MILRAACALSLTLSAACREAPEEPAVTPAPRQKTKPLALKEQTPPVTPVPPKFEAEVRGIDETTREDMTGKSWREGCPVAIEDLRVVELSHYDFSGRATKGELIVAADVAAKVVEAFKALFDAKFPIQRMRPVRSYGGDDDASMADNNTSAFNCRLVGGSKRLSQHAYGRAIDINPVQNPYVRKTKVSPPAGRAYLDRTDVRPGMIVEGGPARRAFRTIGWGWGGKWRSVKDYQHMSASNR